MIKANYCIHWRRLQLTNINLQEKELLVIILNKFYTNINNHIGGYISACTKFLSIICHAKRRWKN